MLVGIWLVVGSIWFVIAHFSSPYYASGNGSFISMLRCEWWQIPLQYQIPTSDASLCSCFRVALDIPPFGTVVSGNDTLVLPATDEEEAAACTAASAAVAFGCFTSNETVLAEQGVDLEFCEECVAGGQTSQGCEDYGASLIASGMCGYPAEYPSFQFCTVMQLLYLTLIITGMSSWRPCCYVAMGIFHLLDCRSQYCSCHLHKEI